MAESNETYDIVLTGGRVIDPESGLDAVRNVGIKGDKIASVTEESITGKETIDASGHVVCPGFIDMHHHNCAVPFGEKLALRDGITTPLELEGGVWPVDEWYAAVEGKCRTNYGASVGTMPVREHIFNPKYKTVFAGDVIYDMIGAPGESHTTMKWSTQVATPDEIKRVEQLLDEGLAQGSIGVGHTPGYMVDGCTQAESVIVQKLAGKYGQAAYVHARFSGQMPPTSGILGFLEMMAPQEVYGGGVLFHHMSAQALKDTITGLNLFDAAREKGIKVMGELYPYDYGGSIVGADYLHPDNYQRNMARDYKDIIEVANMTPLTKERYEELNKTAPTTSILFYNAREEDVRKGIAHPTSVVGSDAFPYTIRETLAVSKMTYMIARFLEDNGVPQMADKGRIQEGKDADITIFDPETVQENATMKDGGLPSTGIPYVLVNGTVVVRDSETVDDVFPGKPVRGSATVA
jgi:hypothetical protein